MIFIVKIYLNIRLTTITHVQLVDLYRFFIISQAHIWLKVLFKRLSKIAKNATGIADSVNFCQRWNIVLIRQFFVMGKNGNDPKVSYIVTQQNQTNIFNWQTVCIVLWGYTYKLFRVQYCKKWSMNSHAFLNYLQIPNYWTEKVDHTVVQLEVTKKMFIRQSF